MTVQRVSASRRIQASAHALFEIVSSPDGHVRIDGSGMLDAAPDARPLAAVGDVFDMEMDRTPLNDIPRAPVAPTCDRTATSATNRPCTNSSPTA